MKAKDLKKLFVILITVMTVSSCSLLGGKDYGMASDESIAKIKELIKANVNTDDYKINRILWVEDTNKRKLQNVLTRIDITYLGKDNYEYRQAFTYEDGKFIAGEVTKSKEAGDSYKLTTGIDLDQLNAEKILANVDKADELVHQQEGGEEYEYKSIERYQFEIYTVPLRYEEFWEKWGDDDKKDYRELKQTFKLNYTKKNESSEVRGHSTWTNYYTIPFKVNEAGEVVIDERAI